MARSILIYEGKGSEFSTSAGKWQDQWVHAEEKYKKGEIRSSVSMALKLGWVDYVKLVAQACKDAGSGGQVLFLVGHGGDASTLMPKKDKIIGAEGELAVGMFDLAPCKKIGKTKTCDFRMGTEDVFYDYSPPSSVARVISPMEHDFQEYAHASPAQKKAITASFMDYLRYRMIGHCAQSAGLRQLVLLNCNVGNATTFMQKVTNDWQVPVVAFTRRLESREEPDTDKVRMYAFGEAFGEGSNQIEARYNYPKMHARLYKPNGPAGLPMAAILNSLSQSQSKSSPPGKPPAKPVGKPQAKQFAGAH
jgi:hypothetical protein